MPRAKKPRKFGDLEKWDYANEAEALRNAGRIDFWTFFQHIFGAHSNPKGKRWIDPQVHEPMARWFQKHVDEWFDWRAHGWGKQKHLAVLVHREVGKTTMFVQAGIAWLHLRDPEISTYIGSEKLELATKSLAAIKSIIDGSDPYALFAPLYGNWSDESKKWTGTEIVHTGRKNISRRDPSIGTFAVETSIVGAHPDAIFYDDPISYERLRSDTNWLDTVNSQLTSLIPVIQSDGLFVNVGTRYDDLDHFGVAFRDEGVASLEGMETDSITVDKDGKWHVYFLAAKTPDGVLTTPKVWNERRLLDFQRRDPLRYAAQVMNDPSISELNPITRDQLEQCKVNVKDVPWGSLRFAVLTDVAFSDGDRVSGKDETVLIVHGYPRNGSGDVYVIEGYGSNQWRAEDFYDRLVALVQRYRRQGRTIFMITGEKSRSGLKGAIRSGIQNRFSDVNEPMPPYYEFERGDTKKYNRLQASTTFWVDGHVRIIRDSPGSEQLIKQMSRIGQYAVNKKIKIDWADAHSDAFQPELYQPMRRIGPQKAPYERGSIPIEVDGLDPEMFDDSDGGWSMAHPRPPIRG